MSFTEKKPTDTAIFPAEENIKWYRDLLSNVETVRLPQQLPRHDASSKTDKAVFTETTFREISYSLTESERSSLAKLTGIADISMDCVCIAIWQMLIVRYCRIEDLALAIDTTFLHTAQGDSSGITVLRQVQTNDSSFERWIHQTADHLRALEKNGALTIDILDSYFDEEDLATSTNNYPVLIHHPSLPAVSANKHELSLSIEVSTPTSVNLGVNYNSATFDHSDMERMLEHFQTLLVNGTLHPQMPVNRLRILSNNEHDLVIKTFNTSSQEYRTDLGFTDLFEEQVKNTPDRIAVSTTDCRLSYKELFEQVEKMSTWLMRYELQADDLVAICLPRDTELIVAQIAVQRTGAAYLPIDPEYPKDRINYILSDASVKLFITTSLFHQEKSCNGSILIELDNVRSEIQTTIGGMIKHSATADNLAYVIYTSGTTGKPKGVEITRRNLANQLNAVQQVPPFCEEDVVIALTTVAFDVSIVELFLPLTVGARVHIAPREIAKDGHLLKEVIESEQITRLDATPSLWRLLLETGWTGNQRLTGIVGGEALPTDLAKKLVPKLKSFWNMYGPTETTVSCTAAHIQDPDLPITIGQPLANYRIYILNKDNSPCPINVTGEICIAGDSTARGYLNRPELNNKVFSEDPFAKDAGRMYRTGDLGRWLPDGNIECLGRIDSQVKLRGYRIELGEIESLISARSDIRHSVVALGSHNGNDYLAAYVVPFDSDKCSSRLENSIKAELKESLPPYMIPSTITFLEVLPLTPNGKIDLKALSGLETKPEIGKNDNPPVTDTEKHIATLWTEFLGDMVIRRDDNFFALGGHSLLAMRFVTRANSHYENKLTARTIVTSSLAHIAEILSPNNQDTKDSEANNTEQHQTLSPVFISSNDARLYAGLHRATPSKQESVKSPVLICQPIGHEYQRAQRATRLLATEIAKSGRDVLRFDYAGTGDSTGNLENMSVETWQQNIGDASEFLMKHANSDSFAAIGMRLGGLLLLSSKPNNLNELVLWDSLSCGDQWISSINKMTRLAMNNLDRFRFKQTDKHENEYFGYLFSKETVDSVSALKQDDFGRFIPSSVLLLNSSSTIEKTTECEKRQTMTLNENQLWEDFSTADDMVITPQSTGSIVKWFNQTTTEAS